MGDKTLAETIKEITRQHLEQGNLLLGSNISAVGWVNNTVPDVKGIIELPNSDVAGAGIATGVALMGRHPIFIIRFQDLLMLNGNPLLNYAMKSLELHNKPCPIFIRAIASEGLGCCHSGVFHSIFMHYPGCKVVAPMTPEEYKFIYGEFMVGNKPMLVSEHRDSFKNTEELSNVTKEDAKITLFGIGISRLQLSIASEILEQEGIQCNQRHIYHLKPFNIDYGDTISLHNSKLGLVIDSGYEICGASRDIAYQLMIDSGVPVHALGLKDETKTLLNNNPYPDAQMIVDKVKEILK
jgi:acetoin:2,6-dichlorophenolindophenol oxidoreductase subunit beta